MTATQTRTKRTPAPKRRPVVLSERQRLAELRAYVRLCFWLISEDDLKEVVNRTGLSLSTLTRLAGETYALSVRYGTIQRLGQAAGIRLVMEDKSVSLEML